MEGRTLALELEEALLQALDQERVFLEYNRSIGGGGEVLLVDDVEEMRHYLAQKHRNCPWNGWTLVSNIRALQLELDVARRTWKIWRCAPLPHPKRCSWSCLARVEEICGCTWPHAAPDGCRVTTCRDEGKDALSVERFARVVQTTGLDWEDVARPSNGRALGRGHAPSATLLSSSDSRPCPTTATQPMWRG